MNLERVHRVFVDLDNTLLPFDTLWPVWKAILAAGLRPNPSKVTLHLGFQSIAKSNIEDLLKKGFPKVNGLIFPAVGY